jgi:CRP-like cAMP-binding protein
MVDKLDFLEGLDGSELVQDTFLFRELSFDETAKLAGAFQKRTFAPGATIIEENAIGDALYIIRSGTVQITKADGADRRVLTELGAGELVGEMSLIEASLTSASVVAKDDVECLMLARPDLERMMRESSEFARKVYKAFCNVLSDRLRRTSQELFELQRSLTK